MEKPEIGDQPFWLPSEIDYRGRMYPRANIASHLMGDKYRSLFKFATKKKLGPKPENGDYSGFEWLLIHCVNSAEILKKPTREEALIRKVFEKFKKNI